MGYSNIKSKFVKKKLKGLPFSKREYIDDLIKIESIVTGKTFGLVTGHLRNRLKQKYPKACKAIHLELDAKGYKETLKLEREEAMKERVEDKKFEREEKEELLRSRGEWVKLGGVC